MVGLRKLSNVDFSTVDGTFTVPVDRARARPKSRPGQNNVLRLVGRRKFQTVVVGHYSSRSKESLAQRRFSRVVTTGLWRSNSLTREHTPLITVPQKGSRFHPLRDRPTRNVKVVSFRTDTPRPSLDPHREDHLPTRTRLHLSTLPC